LIASGSIKRDFIQAHTIGFEEFAEFVAPFNTDRVAEETTAILL
jgi:assimilatory nitrate reductase catalytic subunit